jgi:hypothetical protein
VDFFEAHGGFSWLLLAGLLTFPRLTLLFVGGPFLAWMWVCWFFIPHTFVAFLAYIKYAETNPALVAVSIIVAVFATLAEIKIFLKSCR